MHQLKLVLAQLNFLVGDIHGNTKKILAAVEQAKTMQADLIAFPELALTGYPPEDLLLRQDFLQQANLALTNIAAASQNIAIVLGHPQTTAQGLMNAASVLQNGRIAKTYYKQYLPNYGVFDERRYFNTGQHPCIFDLQGLQVGLIICEDTWFAEPALQAKAAGAQLLLTLNASPFDTHHAQQRLAIIQARQQQTQLPIAYVNTVGAQDELVFDGGSLCVNTDGQIVAAAPYFQEDLLTIQLSYSEQGVHIPLQNLTNPSNEIALIYQALVLGVRDYVNKNHFPGIILGLSGGIDSALTLAIAVDALGKDRVHAYMLPSRHTSDLSVNLAKQQAELLHVNYAVIDIEPAYQAFLHSLATAFAGLAIDITEENLQSRCRGTILMALSNKTGKLVLTTGNKSEMATGYATLYGDMAGGFCVLKDVLKTQVFALAHYRNSISQVIPEAVISRPPSAELAPDQRDEDNLAPYPIVDEIIARFVEQEQSIIEIIAAGFEAATVQKIVKLILHNEYKRRQSPPGIKISTRAFGRERRYPITSGFSGQG